MCSGEQGPQPSRSHIGGVGGTEARHLGSLHLLRLVLLHSSPLWNHWRSLVCAMRQIGVGQVGWIAPHTHSSTYLVFPIFHLVQGVFFIIDRVQTKV